MFSKPWQNWLTILLILLLGGPLASFFFSQQRLIPAANYCLWGSQLLAVAWTLWGQWKKRDVRWIKWSGVLTLGTVLVIGLSGFYFGWAHLFMMMMMRVYVCVVVPKNSCQPDVFGALEGQLPEQTQSQPATKSNDSCTNSARACFEVKTTRAQTLSLLDLRSTQKNETHI